MMKNDKTFSQSSCASSPQRALAPVPWPTAILLFWPAALVGAALDLWSKAAVFSWLPTTPAYRDFLIDGVRIPEHRYVIIDGFLQFILRENSGAAFSAFQGWTKFLIVVSCAALIVVIGIFFSRKVTHRLVLFAMGCITAGIVGNLYDRLFNEGRVRDFIDVYVGSYHWPTFNVADSLLCIGVGLLIITNLKSSPE